MMNMSPFAYLTMTPPRKCSQNTKKVPIEEASISKSAQEEYVVTPGIMYDATKGLINKETSLKWGEAYQMFNNYIFSHMEENDPNLHTFINIRRSKL
jgi:hypothetical protein